MGPNDKEVLHIEETEGKSHHRSMFVRGSKG